MGGNFKPARLLWHAAVHKTPWGRIRHSAQLAKAVELLAPPDLEAAISRLETHDATLIPVLNKAMDKFVRRAVYGALSEPATLPARMSSRPASWSRLSGCARMSSS